MIWGGFRGWGLWYCGPITSGLSCAGYRDVVRMSRGNSMRQPASRRIGSTIFAIRHTSGMGKTPKELAPPVGRSLGKIPSSIRVADHFAHSLANFRRMSREVHPANILASVQTQWRR